MIRKFLLLLFLLPVGCTDGLLDQNAIVPYEPVPNYQFFRVPEPGTRVIRTENEWLEFCNKYWSEGIKAPLPAIDFDTKIVLGIFWGDNCRYSGCTNASPSIELITLSARQVTVKVGPVADLGTCEMCVLPICMVTIPRTDLPVVFTGSVPQ
jgi:hypothetical protein